jgi:hypothetical protein
MAVARLREDASPRFIDPNAPIEQQIETLKLLIKDPPENSRIIVYSPALADFILKELNKTASGKPSNRKFKPVRIKRYGDVMAAEEWALTGDTIKFSKHAKRLLDGQNRLAGCARSGKPFRSHTVFGIDDAAFASIDSNTVRTNTDTLYVYGVPNSSLVTPGVRWVKLHREAEAGEDPDRGDQLTNPVALEFYKTEIDQERMQEAAERVKAMPRAMFKKGLMRGPLTGLFYLFAEKHAATMKKVAVDAARNERGMRKLYKTLEERRDKSGGRISETIHNALVIKCWNAYRKGETVVAKHLKWDGATYPTIE